MESNAGFNVNYTKCIPRFDFSDEAEREQGKKYLEENGYVVIKGVLSTEDIEHAKDLFWRFVEEIPDRMDQICPGFKNEMYMFCLFTLAQIRIYDLWLFSCGHLSIILRRSWCLG